MAKLIIETGDENEILRTVSESIKVHEIRNYKGLAEDMLKYIKDPKNG